MVDEKESSEIAVPYVIEQQPAVRVRLANQTRARAHTHTGIMERRTVHVFRLVSGLIAPGRQVTGEVRRFWRAADVPFRRMRLCAQPCRW